eukprot:5103000-Prymnesium_polylepis.1
MAAPTLRKSRASAGRAAAVSHPARRAAPSESARRARGRGHRPPSPPACRPALLRCRQPRIGADGMAGRWHPS